MKHKWLFLLFYYFISISHSYGQFKFQKAYHYPYYAYDIAKPTSDSGFVVTGTFYTQNGTTKSSLIKTNSTGDTLWTMSYDNSNGANDVIETQDGGYFYATSYFIKTNSLGEVLWAKKASNGASINCCSALELSNGAIVVAGRIINAGNSQFMLTKLDSTGSVVFSQSFGGASNDVANNIIKTIDDGFIIAGTTNWNGTGGQAALIKTDSLGQIEWAFNYGGSMYNEFNSVVQTDDGGFLALGLTVINSNQKMLIVKVDSGGNIVWSKAIYHWSSSRGYMLLKKNNNSFYLAGMTSSSSGGTSAALVSVDSLGSVNWAKRISETPSNVTSFASIQHTLDSGLVLCGTVDPAFGTGPGYAYLMKTDSLATGNCFATNINMSTTPFSPVDSLVTYSPAPCNLMNFSLSYSCLCQPYADICDMSPHGEFMSLQNSICDSACVNFIDNSSNNPTSWQWNFPGGTPDTSSAQHPIGICYSIPGNYSVELIVSNIYGTDTIVKTNYVSVHNSPSAYVSYNDSLLCAIDSIPLSATTNTGVSFQWFHNMNTLSGATGNVYDAILGGQYYFSTTDSFGCQTFSDTIELYQDSLPSNSNLDVTYSNCISGIICAPLDSTFSYLWNTNETSPCISIDSSGIYSVIITNATGCTSIADTNFIFPSPGYFTLTSPNSCDSVQLCGYSGYISYLWSNGDTSQCINVFNTDSFTVTLIDTNYCTLVGTIYANVIHLSASLVQLADTLFAYPIDSSYTYLWLYNGIPNILCDSVPFCVLTANGNYQVIISDTNGCVDTSAVISVLNVGMNQNPALQDFKIIPNPTAGEILLELTTTSTKEVIIQIISAIGQNLYTESWNVNKNINRKNIDLSNFSNGKYHCVIIVDGMTTTKTFEIIHD